MQNNTTLRFYLIPVRMGKIKKPHMTSYAAEDVEQGEHSSSAVGSANLYSHFVNQYDRFSQN